MAILLAATRKGLFDLRIQGNQALAGGCEQNGHGLTPQK